MHSDSPANVERLEDRFRGALLGVAVGDALGALLEGGPMRSASDLASWVHEPPHPLRYTDDTHLTLASARSLVERRGFDAEHMADAIAAQFEREPWRGYGAGPPHVFHEMRHGRRPEEVALELFDGSGSFGNGAAMRIAPIGLAYFASPERAAEIGRDAARITHAHPLGEDGAALQAAAVAELLQAPDCEPAALLARLQSHVRTRWFRELVDKIGALGEPPAAAVVEILGNGIEAHRSVGTALHAYLRHRNSFADAVLFALSLGGDADTIASMTGALAGAALGASAIPDAWAQRVEGREELLELAAGLLELASAPA
jgi:poly(ADP-ribose) glycohydrolase ARH3